MTALEQHDQDLLDRIHDLAVRLEDEAFLVRFEIVYAEPLDPNVLGDRLETLRIFALDLVTLADRWNGTQRTQPMEAD